MNTGIILKMRHHRRGKGTKHTGRLVSDQHRHHHENKRVKSEEKALRIATILKRQSNDVPMPFIDIGINKLDSIITSLIDSNASELRSKIWQQIIKRHPMTENDVVLIIQDVISIETINKANDLKSKMNNNIHTRQQTDIVTENPKLTKHKFSSMYPSIFNKDALIDKWIDSIFWGHRELKPQYLLPNTKCPRCTTGFVMREINRTVCINCGFSEDLSSTQTLKKEYLIKWLIRNRTENFSPPYSLLLPHSEQSLFKQTNQLMKEIKWDESIQPEINLREFVCVNG